MTPLTPSNQPMFGAQSRRGQVADGMREALPAVYRALAMAYGPQHWWPGDGPFEVMVGAVLTQNTAWRNVARAIADLKQAGALSLGGLLNLAPDELAGLIRPAGCYNLKTRRLRNLCRWLDATGGLAVVRGWPTARLRRGLLAVNGVGPETADAILLYAFNRPVFVVDAYLRRIFSRVGLVIGTEPYEVLRARIEAAVPDGAGLYNEYHALLVEHAKRRCGPQPRCAPCCLRVSCAHGRRATAAGDARSRDAPG